MTALNDAINRRDALRLLGAAAAWTAVAPTPSAAQADIKAFNVHVDNKDLADLRRRLANTVWPPDATGTPWSMGTDLAYMRQLIAYWKDKYDWRAHEAALNRFDQYTTTIDGQKIHFIHQKSRRPDAIALVMTHGYPGTIWEMLPSVPALVDPTAHGGTAADAFHVIVSALPGYPFSGEPADATNSRSSSALPFPAHRRARRESLAQMKSARITRASTSTTCGKRRISASKAASPSRWLTG